MFSTCSRLHDMLISRRSTTTTVSDDRGSLVSGKTSNHLPDYRNEQLDEFSPYQSLAEWPRSNRLSDRVIRYAVTGV